MSAPPPSSAAVDEPLLDTLQRAEPRGPRGLSRPDPGAALALAAHCCMIEAGFKVRGMPLGWEQFGVPE